MLGDIGATNARFALLASGAVGPVTSLDVTRFARFADAVATLLKDHCQQIEITNAILAVAGPIEGERCVLTNCSWVIDARELYETLRLEARMVNDFAAGLFLTLSYLGGSRRNRRWESPIRGNDGRAGTGERVRCCLFSPGLGKPVVIPSEGGHATLAGTCDREDEIVKQLRMRFGHVSAERMVSGDGLENIYQAIVALDGLSSCAPKRSRHHEVRAMR